MLIRNISIKPLTVSLQKLLDIEHPVIQAPMAGVQDSALVIAVSNAGGFGSLPCAILSNGRNRNRSFAQLGGGRRAR